MAISKKKISFNGFSYQGYNYSMSHEDNISHPFLIVDANDHLSFQAIQDIWFQVEINWEKMEEMAEDGKFLIFRFQNSKSPDKKANHPSNIFHLKKETITQFKITWNLAELKKDSINKLNFMSEDNPDIELEIDLYFRDGKGFFTCPNIIWNQNIEQSNEA